jgi:hypothetical protein
MSIAGKLRLSLKATILITLAVLMTRTSSSGQTTDLAKVEYLLLRDRRPYITFPTYLPAEKQTVADVFERIMNGFYVHKEEKSQWYGTDYTTEVQRIKLEAQTLSEKELHQRIFDVISSQHDLHLRQTLPKPHACYSSLLPVDWTRVDGSGKSLYLITALTTKPEVLALAPELSKIAVGDQVTTYNGQTVEDAAQSIEGWSFGANPDATNRRTHDNLNFRWHARVLPPAEDIVVLGIKKQDGTDILVTLPWITRATASCFPAVKPLSESGYINLTDNGSDDELEERQKVFRAAKISPSSQKIKFGIKELNQTLPVPDFGNLKTTPEPAISYKILNDPNGDIGYLKLSSFSPATLDRSASLQVLREILQTQMSNTKGLIIDLRGNGGGSIVFGERMAQLFTGKAITPIKMRALRTPETRLMTSLFNGETPLWQEIASTVLMTPKTGFSPLTAPYLANNLGRAYYEPVTVLTDAYCYSTCDMFASLMQDHGAAKIIGLDHTTGAGGANNWGWDGVNFHKNGNQYYPELPYSVGFSFSFRQVGRPLKSDQLIENTGVISDEVWTQSEQDIIGADYELARKLMSDLQARTSTTTSKMALAQLSYDLEQKQDLNLEVTTSGVSSLAVLGPSGELVRTLTQDGLNVLTVTSGQLSGLHSNESLKVTGYDNNGDPVAQEFIEYRVLKAATNDFIYSLNSERYSKTDGMDFYTLPSSRPGFAVMTDGIRISETMYRSATQYWISIQLDLSQMQTPRLEFDHTGKVLPDEAPRVTVLDRGLSTGHEGWAAHPSLNPAVTVVSKFEPTSKSQTHSVELTKWAGKKIEVRIELNTDQEGVEPGPTFTRIELIK